MKDTVSIVATLAVVTVVNTGSGSYEVYDEDGALLGSGQVGQLESIDTGSGILSLHIGEMAGDVDQSYQAWRSSRSSAISDLQSRFSVVEQGEWSGILAISLTGDSPVEVRRQLDEIADVYVGKSVEQRSAEVQQTLNFLDQQLPTVRAGVEKAELALNAYRLEKGSIDLSLETQSILQTIVALERQVNELEQERGKATLGFYTCTSNCNCS